MPSAVGFLEFVTRPAVKASRAISTGTGLALTSQGGCGLSLICDTAIGTTFLGAKPPSKSGRAGDSGPRAEVHQRLAGRELVLHCAKGLPRPPWTVGVLAGASEVASAARCTSGTRSSS